MRDGEEPGWEGAQARGTGLVLGGPQLVRWWVKGHPQGQATGSLAAAPLLSLGHSLTLRILLEALGLALASGKPCVYFLS